MGKPAIPLRKAVVLVGARKNAHIHLLSDSVSKAHALILNGSEGCFIRDLASRAGVYVNDAAVTEARLSHGDLIRIGSFLFRYSDRPNRPRGEESPGRLSAAPRAGLRIPGEPDLPIAQRVLLIGRRYTCDIARLEPEVSTAHAVIFELDGAHHVRDLGSRTGTFVNDQRVHQQVLVDGDVVRVGQTEMNYGLLPEAAAEMAAPTLTAVETESEQDRLTSAEAQALLEPQQAETSPADLSIESALEPAPDLAAEPEPQPPTEPEAATEPEPRRTPPRPIPHADEQAAEQPLTPFDLAAGTGSPVAEPPAPTGVDSAAALELLSDTPPDADEELSLPPDLAEQEQVAPAMPATREDEVFETLEATTQKELDELEDSLLPLEEEPPPLELTGDAEPPSEPDPDRAVPPDAALDLAADSTPPAAELDLSPDSTAPAVDEETLQPPRPEIATPAPDQAIASQEQLPSLELEPPELELETPELELGEVEALKDEPAAERPVPELRLEESVALELDEPETQVLPPAAEAEADESGLALEKVRDTAEPVAVSEALPAPDETDEAPPEIAESSLPDPDQVVLEPEESTSKPVASEVTTADPEPSAAEAGPAAPVPPPMAERPAPPPQPWGGADRDGYLGGMPLPLGDGSGRTGVAHPGRTRRPTLPDDQAAVFRGTDVFSDVPAGIDESIFADAAPEEPGQLDPLAGVFLPPSPEDSGEITRGVPGSRRSTNVPDRPPPPVAPLPVEPIKRRRRWFRLPVLLMAMLLSGVVAVALIYTFVPVQYTFEATMRYAGTDQMTEYQRRELLIQQQRLLERAELRHSARQALRRRPAQVAPGFLDDTPAAVLRYVEAAGTLSWSGSGSNDMSFRYTGTDRVGDRARMEALVSAWYDANLPLVDESRTRQQRWEQARQEHEEARQRLERSRQRRDEVKQLVDRRQALERRELEMRRQVARLEEGWREAQAELVKAEQAHAQSVSEQAAARVMVADIMDDEFGGQWIDAIPEAGLKAALHAAEEKQAKAAAGEKQAQQAYEAAVRELDGMRAELAGEDLKQAVAEYPEFEAEHSTHMLDLEQARTAEEAARRAAAASVAPVLPDLRNDVRPHGPVDSRATYAAGAMAVIVLVFTALMLGAHFSENTDEPAPPVEPDHP